VARPNWSRELPRPLKIPTIMTLTTLADVRKLSGHLPAKFRERDTWQHVADRLHNAAHGGDIKEAVIAAIGAATRTSTMLAAMTGAGKTRFADCLTDMALS